MGSCKTPLQLCGCLSTLSSCWLLSWPRPQDSSNNSNQDSSNSSSSNQDSSSNSQDSSSSNQDSSSSNQDSSSSSQDSSHLSKVSHPSKLWTDSDLLPLSSSSSRSHPDQKFSSILRWIMDNVERIMVGSQWSCLMKSSLAPPETS